MTLANLERLVETGIDVEVTWQPEDVAIAAFTRLLPVWAEQVLHAGGNHQASASVVIALGSVLMIPPGLWVSGRARRGDGRVAAPRGPTGLADQILDGSCPAVNGRTP